MRLDRLVITLLSLMILDPGYATAEQPPLDVPTVTTAPAIDGVLDEATWRGALVVDDFVARQPVDGATPSMRTEVRLIHTRRALYVGLHAYDPEPERIRATSMRRDDFAITSGDQFVIAIDSFRDRRTGYWFSTNPLGARVDAQFSDEGDRFDDAWDGVWSAAARVDATGWTAELEIPWATLRFHQGPTVVMGINLYRRIPHTNEQVFAPAISLLYAYGTPNVSAARAYRFSDISGGARFDLRPFALARTEQHGIEERTNKQDTGLFARTPLTDAITFFGTLNADFSEVEADENQLNLTPFPLFLPEKRDFFLEGAGLFEFGVPGEAELFFSRAIGLVTGPAGETETVPIDWGGKATGRVGAAEIGLLSGATGAASTSRGERFDVARVRVDLGKRSTIGGFWSRRTSAGSEPHMTYGADFNHFFPGELRLQGFAAGDERGASHENAWYAALTRAGERAAFTLSMLDLEPGFAPALGLLARPGTRRVEASATLPWFAVDSSRVRRYAPGISFIRYDDLQDDGFDERGVLSFGIAWKNDFTLTGEVARQRERWSVPFTIYRQIMITAGDYQRWEGALSFASDPTRPLSATAKLLAGGLYGGSHRFVDLEVTWRPNRYVVFGPAVLTDWVHLPDTRFIASVARVRIGLTASSKLRFDILAQSESEHRGVGIGLRTRYDFREGTRIVLAWDSVELRLPSGSVLNAPTPARPLRTNRGALKVSYLFLF
jgi:hypothetical protein